MLARAFGKVPGFDSCCLLALNVIRNYKVIFAMFFPICTLCSEHCCSPDGAARIFLPPDATTPGFKPMSVELHGDPGPLKDALPTELPHRGK